MYKFCRWLLLVVTINRKFHSEIIKLKSGKIQSIFITNSTFVRRVSIHYSERARSTFFVLINLIRHIILITFVWCYFGEQRAKNEQRLWVKSPNIIAHGKHAPHTQQYTHLYKNFWNWLALVAKWNKKFSFVSNFGPIKRSQNKNRDCFHSFVYNLFNKIRTTRERIIIFNRIDTQAGWQAGGVKHTAITISYLIQVEKLLLFLFKNANNKHNGIFRFI